MSTTSLPCPFAAALSRADRRASALVISISSGVATTGTPSIISTGNVSSSTCAPPMAAGAAASAAHHRPGVVPGSALQPSSVNIKHEKNFMQFIALTPSRVIRSEIMREPSKRRRTWTLLTGHGHVLVEIARNPEARIRDISPVVGLTVRFVQAIVADLEAAGYLTRTRI